MTPNLDLLNVLSGQYVGVILVAGLKGPLYATRMVEDYNMSSSTWNRQKKKLIKLGLIQDIETIEAKPPFIVAYPLTEKGRKIAEHLREIYKILKDEA